MTQFTSAYFPHVDIVALENFAAAAAAAEHANRVSRNGSMARLSTRGKGKARAQDKDKLHPKIVGFLDTVWAGEKANQTADLHTQAILITIAPDSAPLGPHQMIAYFPHGRPTYTTKAMVGMTQLVRDSAQVGAPKIYGYYDNATNPVKAEVVLLEMVQGDNLAEVFHKLSTKQVMTICARLGDVLVKLFACRGPYIGSETNVADSPPRSAEESSLYRAPVLLSWPFDEGPLAHMSPQEASTSTHDYLLALSKRPERVFDGSDPQALEAGRKSGRPDARPLTSEDIVVIRDTWNRLGSLIPYHSGGFYIPGTLSPEARYMVYSVLQSKEYGVRHGDLSMFRIFVRWARPGDENSDAVLVIAGWEHAHRAPLWSCARMPPWLVPHVHPYELLTWESQRDLRSFIIKMIANSAYPRAKEWIIANAYGETERWFEGMLSSHWEFRDTIEVLLVHLRTHWMHERPDVPFPLHVGGPYISRVDLPTQRVTRQTNNGEPEAGERWEQALRMRQELLEKGPNFFEEMRIAMSALGLNAGDALRTEMSLTWPHYAVDDVD
ncbi:hypothetical protein K488DRAFT_46196 [Vararia minispora EC-137]|uniref:Uncharacterized protein n=1 Tax=Vararia minispora EC-137 TaxID=1314806 RepID=A0ACB8QR18_9AGAM|nr:hypothetical protein K488DRAFT_46196 [Vararia minispora EC-137]